MRQVAVLVEGQTEEAFVKRVLQPHVGWSVYLTPIVVHTSRAADGTARRGGGTWKNYDRQLRNLLAQHHWSMITTLVDYYGYPVDAPSCKCATFHDQPHCVESRESAIRATLPSDARFTPFLMLHEFETIVIAAGAQQPDVLGDIAAAELFRTIIEDNGGNAELIDNGPTTAPSKRVASALTAYSKVRDGIAILEGALPGALSVTPRMNAWVSRIQALAVDPA